jgi:hypothetical protein
MEENSNVANELREAVKKAFAEGNTASDYTELVVLPTKQVLALVEENNRLRKENSNLALANNTQNAELGLLRKGDLDRCGDINDDAVLESRKEMAVKAPNLHVNRVLRNAIRLILQLKDEKAELQKQVDELKEELEKAYEIERANIQAEIAEAGTSCHWCKAKTEKDTAKEILGELDLFFKGTTFRKGYEFKKIDEELKELKKRNGVEVE